MVYESYPSLFYLEIGIILSAEVSMSLLREANYMNLNLFIAWRYLLTRQKEAFVSIINIFAISGIALGVATLIIVMSVMNGYEHELISKILGLKGHLTIISNDGLIEDYDDLIDTLEKCNEVSPLLKQISPVLEGQAMAMSKNSFAGVLLKGMKSDDLCKKSMVSEAIVSGDIDDGGVLIGISMAGELKAIDGSGLKLIVPQSSSTMIGSIPRMKTYKISGIFDVGMYEYNSSIVFAPLSLTQVLLDTGDKVSHIEIFAHDIKQIDALYDQILRILPSKYRVLDWQTNNQTLVQALRVERNVMFLILSLLIVIATLNIVSSLMILVKDKTKSIAIMRTVGFSKGMIMKIFCMCGFSIGLMGTALGTLLGISFSLNINGIKEIIEEFSGKTLFDPVIYFLTSLPSHLEWAEVGQVVALSLFFSLVATIYPAIRIAKLAPAEVLKYE